MMGLAGPHEAEREPGWLHRDKRRKVSVNQQATPSFSKREHSGSASALSLVSVPPGLAPRAEALRSASEPLPSSLGPGLSEPACQGASGPPEACWVSRMRGWVGCKPDVLGARLSPGAPFVGCNLWLLREKLQVCDSLLVVGSCARGGFMGRLRQPLLPASTWLLSRLST